jgi:two-component system response regulator (stage 0 sporulation protein A)
MNVLNAVFFTKDEKAVLSHKRLFDKTDVKINVMANVNTFYNLIILAGRLVVDLLIVDCDTVRLHEEIFGLFDTSGGHIIPNIILISSDESLLSSLSEEFPDYHCFKTKSFISEFNKAAQLMSAKAVMRRNRTTNGINIDAVVSRHLLKLGFVPKHTGYSYLTDVIKLIVANRGNMGSLLNDVYPVIAEKYNTNPKNVERNIRNAIDSAWLNADIDILNSEFGYTVDKNKGKPTNRAFIATVADKIIFCEGIPL